MEAERYDFVVIGSGPAGEKAAAQAAYFGKRVALVERAKDLGGVAVTSVGMIPTKTLREAALYVTGFRKREIYGVSCDVRGADVQRQVNSRTDDVSETMSTTVRENVTRHRIELIHGTAALAGDGMVTVTSERGNSRLLRADAILIATGSRPYHPEHIPFDDPDVVDCERVMDIDGVPRSVVVVGGGAIGCEHASIYTALGSHVTLVDGAERLLMYVDAELSRELQHIFEEMGMSVQVGASVTSVTRSDGGLEVSLSNGRVERPDKLLFASGRSGNTEGLGLDIAGVETDSRGRIIVDGRYRTTAKGIYAAGDVIGSPALASASMEQGRVAACDAFGITFKDSIDPMVPTGVYSIPEVAGVGLTEQDAQKQGIDYEVGRGRFTTNPRANIAGVTDGLIKLVFRRADRVLLGVHILGEVASELIHIGQSALHHNDPIDYFIDTTFNVPTYSEAYKYAAYDGFQRLAATTTRSPWTRFAQTHT